MMKKYIYNMIRCILPTALLLLAVVSCSVTNGDEPCDAANEVTVHLGISITSARSVDDDTQHGTGTPTDLMIWVFGKKAGDNAVYEDDPFEYKKLEGNEELKFSGTDLEGRPVQTIPWTIDIQEYVSLKFVVLMNTGSVTWSPTLSFDGKTTYSDIMEASFSGVNAVTEDNKVLMIGEYPELVLSSKRSYDITLEATRVVGKMELYFTCSSASSDLTITDLKISNLPTVGYVDKDKTPTSFGTFDGVSRLTDTDKVTGIAIDGVLEPSYNIGNFHEYENNFTPLTLSNPYLLVNPNGIEWNAVNPDYVYEPGNEVGVSQNAYKLTVSYKWGDVAQPDKSFYLPPIERNHLYKIYVRVKDQGIQLFYEVAEWSDVEYKGLVFDYPNNSPLYPAAFDVENGTKPDGGFPQPTVYYSDSDAGNYSFKFTVSYPNGQEWTPTLFDATEGEYEVKVFKGTEEISEPYKVDENYTDYYVIQIKANQPLTDGQDKEVELAISYTPSWDPIGTSLLLINEKSSSWIGSTSSDRIVIKQVNGQP